MLHCFEYMGYSFVYRQVDISKGVTVLPGTLTENGLQVTIYPTGASTSSKDSVSFTVSFDQSVPAGEEYAAALAVMPSIIQPSMCIDSRIRILVRRRATPSRDNGPLGLYEVVFGLADQTWWTAKGKEVKDANPRNPS